MSHDSEYKRRKALNKYQKQILDARRKLNPKCTTAECDILGDCLQMTGESVRGYFNNRRKKVITIGEDVIDPEILKLLEDVKQKMEDLNNIPLTSFQERSLQIQFQSDPSLAKMLTLGRSLQLPEKKVKFWVLSRERKDRKNRVREPRKELTQLQIYILEKHLLAGGKFSRAEQKRLGSEINVSMAHIHWWHFCRLKEHAEGAARRSSEESIGSNLTSANMTESMPVSRQETPTSSLYSSALKQWFDDNVFKDEPSPLAFTPSSLGGPDAPIWSFHDTSLPPPPDQLYRGFSNPQPEYELSQAALHHTNLQYSATAHNSSETSYPSCYGQQPHMNQYGEGPHNYDYTEL